MSTVSVLVEDLAEAVETFLPCNPVEVGPVFEGLEASGVELALAHTASLSGEDESAMLQHLQVLPDRCQRDSQGSGEGADGLRPGFQRLNDAAPCLVAEGVKDVIDIDA